MVGHPYGSWKPAFIMWSKMPHMRALPSGSKRETRLRVIAISHEMKRVVFSTGFTPPLVEPCVGKYVERPSIIFHQSEGNYLLKKEIEHSKMSRLA